MGDYRKNTFIGLCVCVNRKNKKTVGSLLGMEGLGEREKGRKGDKGGRE